MPLAEAIIKGTRAAEEPRELFDSGGLYLLNAPGGGKRWRLKCRFGGKEKRLSSGAHPEVTLAAARKLRDEARAFLVAGVDPSEVRKQEHATLPDEAALTRCRNALFLGQRRALSIRLSARRMNRSPSEPAQLRAFLDATRGVTVKE
ncbi:Arm DNA-binding domain-containing protein [Caballeronia sp. LZ062]|uniref:Arm DNA-binding domain-containing protein n=1 Tax=unclassified Caballeronia TaxID=2646786 RepID=UPI00286087E5|nr:MULTISPECIES: Arm DNA-binding domain-containing protein [unclassified Caballeronia]MDR5855979.1 Arm DNA-binding domain-containing protein [Caballeronia sp. LZ050]MDR5872235.1 Arm DNA-binding domain-containing protein [Caballeronia sp. LZ062]